MSDRDDILITPDDLAAALEAAHSGGRPVRMLDVRWRLDRPDGRPQYSAGHLPGAVYVDLDTQLARKGEPREGRHPLPPVEQLEADARPWGIDDGDLVVVYDDLGNMSAARAWWLLRHGGFEGVRMLDGGLRAWIASGRALETGDVHVLPGTVSLEYGSLPVVSMEEAGAIPEHGVLLDARAPERYRGETKPVDPRAGHIPGARNTPTSGNIDAAGRFLAVDDLKARFREAGVTGDGQVATYCGSGVTAAHNTAALMLAGFSAALYPGSWSQWSQHADRPAETGAAQGT
ncbi:sulfurtransferase [Humibacter sp.]|jgi:thiosulfate/3-mercaptopyruvate sulfurtransferase|uniref:sulfurtransferase n=1 Tax=Humibacter sp. TaxID=1940291 RepID=UPI002CB34B7F|nr:sulfurtransferase [Humibacter sp.]HVX06624.1 sulfurtransferase [Humibacter sp.]